MAVVVIMRARVWMVVVMVMRVVVVMGVPVIMVIVMMRVGMGMIVPVVMMHMRRPQRAEPLVHHPSTNPYNRQTRNRPEHLHNLLGHHVLEQEQGCQAKQEHANRMSECHHRSQKHRVLQCSPRANQVCGHNRFAVTRRKSVRGSDSKGDQHRDQDHTHRQIPLMQQPG